MRAASKTNRNMPIITHTYDYPMPRDLGAGLHFGPWLYPALLAYEVPPDDWKTLAKEFIDRLFDLVSGLALQNFHVIRTLGILTPADADSRISSPDWLNEIHPTSSGYGQIAGRFARTSLRGISWLEDDDACTALSLLSGTLLLLMLSRRTSWT
ncbi:hypothetical protein Q8F57_014635 [Paraburkholderia terrae]|uniref:hypothetical protein n=1 Tax=Paraburkholderia terrae TaxID=311230 RepID=UPI00296AC86D|nr:hypothetical protein [Paraburkholderia terrae]MDW3659855.1 hypothetical protein [Paraburkholderia terrae]